MPQTAVSRQGLRLTPQGHLVPDKDDNPPILEDKIASRLVETFAQGSGHGLMWLGAEEVGQALPPILCWWRDFAVRYVGGLCQRTSDTAFTVPPPNAAELATLVLTAPMMPGAEYLNQDILDLLQKSGEPLLTVS